MNGDYDCIICVYKLQLIEIYKSDKNQIAHFQFQHFCRIIFNKQYVQISALHTALSYSSLVIIYGLNNSRISGCHLSSATSFPKYQKFSSQITILYFETSCKDHLS